METCVIRRKAPEKEIDFGSLHPLLARLYTARGITEASQIDLALERLHHHRELLNIDIAVLELANALRRNERILIVGDFDADGATSSALAVRALRKFGAQNIDYLVPNRFEFGYGLSPELVQYAYEHKRPDMIVTVDNGITSVEGVALARKLNMKVIVTDHHLAGETLPDATAIVNPNHPNSVFPSKNLAGVGVIFYTMTALRSYLRDQNWFEEKSISEPNMASFLDLVALGTVADVVTLDQNNRILVSQGLRYIRAGRCSPGITALLKISGRDQNRLNASDLGFSVAPRLNAAGRLEDMSLGIECLLTDDLEKATSMAERLDELNLERRSIEQGMQEQAMKILAKFQLDATTLPVGLALYDPEWHQGVIGILAARIKEKFHRPVIAFAQAGENELKASARSIPGINIRDILAEVAMENPNLIDKFGGHAMAAGLSMHRSKFEKFQLAFVKILEKYVSESDLKQSILSDGELLLDHFNLECAELLQKGGPWGQNFPEPLFDGEFQLLDQRMLANKHLKCTLAYPGKTNPIEAIAFNVGGEKWPNYRCTRIRAAFRLDANFFRGRTTLQLRLEHIEALENT